MEKQSTSKLLRLMVAVFALFLLVMTGSVLSACGGNVAHEHKYGSPEHTNPSTCGSTGYDVYTCSECGDKYAVVTAATGKHTFTDGICTVCGVSNGDNLKAILDQINSKVGTTTSPENAHQHNFSTEVKKLDPTCLTFGITVMKCDCGSTSVTSLVQATGHKYSKAGETGNRIPSTCTTNGQIEVVCSQCGDTYWEPNKDDMAPGHDFTYRTKEFAEKNDQAANCVSPARIAYKCTRCDEIQYVNVGDSLGGHFYETDENGNEVWTKVEGSEKGSAAEKPTIDENLKSYIDVGTVDMERACIYCGEKQVKTVAADHDHNFQHTTSEFNRLKEVSYTVTVDGVEKTYTETLTKENCTEEGAENWHCVYAGCEALENDAGKWEEVEVESDDEEAEPTTKYVYRPSGWAAELKDRKEKDTVDGVEHTYEWRAKLNHTYAEKLKNDDGEYTNEAEIEYITEIDKDEKGNVIVSHTGTEAENNTSSWWGQTCELCGREIAFQTKDGENNTKVPDVTKEILVIEREANGGVKFENNEKWITRAWHSWVLYNGKDTAADTTTPETSGSTKKEKIDPPEEPKDYQANKAATCTEAGWNWYWCQDTNCKEIPLWVKVILPPLGHDWYIDSFENPTCETSGTLNLKCQRENCNASLTLSVENYEDVIGEDDWTWNRHTLAKPGEWTEVEEGNLPEYDEKYVALWELGIDATSDEAAEDAIRKLGSITWKDKKDETTTEGSGTGTTTNPAKVHTLEDALKMLIPTGHHWKKSTSGDATVTADYCFGVPSQLYHCDCKMTDCHDEGCKDEWRDENPKQEHKKNAQGEIDTGIYYEYGVCGTAFGLNHDIYKVTYCKTCGLQLSREKVEDRQNYRHFPFDRKNIEALYNTYIPADYKVENGEKFLEVYGAEETARCMSDEARAARLEYARVWIGIEEWWFNNQTSSDLEEDIRPYFYFKSGDKEDGGGFSLYCFDCFDNLHQYVATHKPEANDHTMTATMHYYVKLDSGAMMEISDLNKLTYNVCEYQYYLQYEVVCSCGMKYIGSDPEACYGAGQYIEQVQKDENGNDVLPDGVHYLIPVKEYWNKENYKRGANGEATMDWICVFCGKTFELQVKYEAPKSEPAAADSETTVDPSNVKLVNADNKLILLVDMNGIKLTEEYGLNQRGASANGIFEIDNRWYYGVNKAWTDVYKDGTKVDENVTITGGTEAFYSEQATVLMKVWDANTGDIVIGHRGPAKYMTGYFEAGNQTNWVWAIESMRIGSLLRPNDFVDPTNKEAYTALWNDMFDVKTGTDNDENAKKHTNELLDAYFKRGGEIVLGGNVGEPVKTGAEGSNKSTGFGTLRTDGREGSVQTGEEDGQYNVFVIPDGASIDLNGNTFYGNIFSWGGATIAGVKSGESVIKNGKIVLEDKGRMQVSSENQTDKVSLTLDGVEVTGGETGLFVGTYGNVTIKNSYISAKGYAISTNNSETSGKGTHWVLENSAFISTEHTAFFMPGEGSVDAKDCEFYGYNMGVYLRGDNLEEKTDGTSHARFVNCLFAKGDQASGASDFGYGENTKHFGALTIGNDKEEATSYGSIVKLVLRNCDFEIVKVSKAEGEETTEGAWTPGFGAADGGWDLTGEVASDGCDTAAEAEGKCTEDKCSHRAIVINIYGCTALGKGCMTGDGTCNESCGGQGEDVNGKVWLLIDNATYANLKTHAQKSAHTDTTKDVINPFINNTFSDGLALKGKCKKLRIDIENEQGSVVTPDFGWLDPDSTTPST